MRTNVGFFSTSIADAMIPVDDDEPASPTASRTDKSVGFAEGTKSGGTYPVFIFVFFLTEFPFSISDIGSTTTMTTMIRCR